MDLQRQYMLALWRSRVPENRCCELRMVLVALELLFLPHLCGKAIFICSVGCELTVKVSLEAATLLQRV